MDANLEKEPSAKSGSEQIQAKPMIGVPCSLMDMAAGRMKVHGAAERYIQVLADLCDCTPIQIPALGHKLNFDDLAARRTGAEARGKLLVPRPRTMSRSCASRRTPIA